MVIGAAATVESGSLMDRDIGGALRVVGDGTLPGAVLNHVGNGVVDLGGQLGVSLLDV